jgi:hypothetical protein
MHDWEAMYAPGPSSPGRHSSHTVSPSPTKFRECTNRHSGSLGNLDSASPTPRHADGVNLIRTTTSSLEKCAHCPLSSNTVGCFSKATGIRTSSWTTDFWSMSSSCFGGEAEDSEEVIFHLPNVGFATRSQKPFQRSMRPCYPKQSLERQSGCLHGSGCCLVPYHLARKLGGCSDHRRHD